MAPRVAVQYQWSSNHECERWCACTTLQNHLIKLFFLEQRRCKQWGDTEFNIHVGPGRAYKYLLVLWNRTMGHAILRPKCNPAGPEVHLKPLQVLHVDVTSDGENIHCSTPSAKFPEEPFPLIVVRKWTWARLIRELEEYTGVPGMELFYQGFPVERRRQIASVIH